MRTTTKRRREQHQRRQRQQLQTTMKRSTTKWQQRGQYQPQQQAYHSFRTYISMASTACKPNGPQQQRCLSCCCFDTEQGDREVPDPPPYKNKHVLLLANSRVGVLCRKQGHLRRLLYMAYHGQVLRNVRNLVHFNMKAHTRFLYALVSTT